MAATPKARRLARLLLCLLAAAVAAAAAAAPAAAPAPAPAVPPTAEGEVPFYPGRTNITVCTTPFTPSERCRDAGAGGCA